VLLCIEHRSIKTLRRWYLGLNSALLKLRLIFEKFCYTFTKITIYLYFSALDFVLKYALLKLTYS